MYEGTESFTAVSCGCLLNNSLRCYLKMREIAFFKYLNKSLILLGKSGGDARGVSAWATV